MQLGEPAAPAVREMTEHGDRVDQVDRGVVEREPRLVRGDPEGMERGAEVGLHPVDASFVGIAAMELSPFRLVSEGAHHPPRTTAEVEHPLSLEFPAGGEE